jgi:hypothetical protein
LDLRKFARQKFWCWTTFSYQLLHFQERLMAILFGLVAKKSCHFGGNCATSMTGLVPWLQGRAFRAIPTHGLTGGLRSFRTRVSTSTSTAPRESLRQGPGVQTVDPVANSFLFGIHQWKTPRDLHRLPRHTRITSSFALGPSSRRAEHQPISHRR